MSKYVRTEDGILTVDDFVFYLLKKDARSYGKEILNFEKTNRLVDKYSTSSFYEFDVHTPSASGHLGLSCDSRHCITLECDALKMVEESPNRKADAIEELCDWYFAVSNTNYKTPIKIDFKKKIIYQWQNFIVDYTFEQFIPYHEIYGGIWTDKGPICVAKMNKEGELKLL